MTPKTPIATALMALFAAPLATPAMAQQVDAPMTPAAPAMASNVQAEVALPAAVVTERAPTDDYQPGKATVGGKIPTAIRDIPQSVTVINRAVLDAQSATSLSDALRNVPGITIGGAEGGQIGNNINLRGFSARTDIYLDGFRDRGQYYRDTFNLESVEVLEGPSSMLFGRGSTGGVINQVSKKPGLTPRYEVGGTIGTDDRYRSTVDINQPLSDTAAFRINAFGQSMHSSRDIMSSKDWGVAPSLRLGIGTPTEITISALIEHNRDMPDYGLPALNGHPLSAPMNQFYGLSSDRTVQDVAVVNATVSHKFSPNLTLRNQTQYSRYSIDAIESAGHAVGIRNANGTFTALPSAPTAGLPSYSLDQLWVQLQSHDRKITDTSLSNQTELIAKFPTGPFKHTLVTGMEIGHDTYENQAYSRTGAGMSSGMIGWVPAASQSYASSIGPVTTTVGNLAQSSANIFGIYANDTVELTRHWKVVGGLRWDRFSASVNNTISKPASADQTVNFTSVRTGVIYQPTQSQSYYISYGTSFDPSLETLTVTNGTQALPPVKNRSYEVGAKWDLLGGNLSLNTALFNVNQTNARTQNPDGTYTLDGDIRVRGFELGAVGHITDHWQVIGGYMYLDPKITRALDGTQGNVLANTPRNTFTLWSTYKFAQHWEAGGGLSYMSSRYANNQNTVQVGGYTRWDAMVAYHQPKYDIQLNVWNLFDKRYFDTLIPSDGGRAVPGVGRTVLLSGKYRF